MRRIICLLLGLAGCSGVNARYQCSSDHNCVLAGQAGRCESSGYCSFSVAETTCPSGRRYFQYSANYSNDCVEMPDLLPPATPDLASADLLPAADLLPVVDLLPPADM